MPLKHGGYRLRLTFAGEKFYEYALKSKELDRNMLTEIQNIKSGKSLADIFLIIRFFYEGAAAP